MEIREITPFFISFCGFSQKWQFERLIFFRKNFNPLKKGPKFESNLVHIPLLKIQNCY
jgi:hypothetical protein